MKKMYKLLNALKKDSGESNMNEIHKLDEQIMFFEDAWGMDGKTDLLRLAEERGLAAPRVIHAGADSFTGEGGSILYYPGAAGKPDVAVDLYARDPKYINPAIIELEDGNRLFGLRETGIALSTVYHDAANCLGCGPAAVWAQFRGAVPIDDIERDLVNLQKHRTGENINPSGVTPAALLAHYLQYQGMRISEQPGVAMEEIIDGTTHRDYQNSIFSGPMDPYQKHTFATVYDWPVEQTRGTGHMNAVPGDDLYFWAYDTRPQPTHKYYRPWSAELDNIDVELREDWL